VKMATEMDGLTSSSSNPLGTTLSVPWSISRSERAILDAMIEKKKPAADLIAQLQALQEAGDEIRAKSKPRLRSSKPTPLKYERPLTRRMMTSNDERWSWMSVGRHWFAT